MASRVRKVARRLGYVLGALGLILAVVYLAHLRRDLPLEQLKARWADGASRFLDLDGMQVHYRDEGTGPAIVLLHGTSASLRTHLLSY